MSTGLRLLSPLLLAALLLAGGGLVPKGAITRLPPGVTPTASIFEPKLSANGRWLVFRTGSENLLPEGNDPSSDVFLLDTKQGDLIQVSRTFEGGNPGMSCQRPSLSASGRFVVYDSADQGIVEGDEAGTTDVFVFDRVKQTTVRVSQRLSGGGASSPAIDGTISKNGRLVAFSTATNLMVEGDLNNKSDVFVRDLKTGELRIVSLTSTGAFADAHSEDPRLSANGRFVIFSSLAALVPEDDNGVRDVYYADLKAGTLVLASADALGVVGDADSGNGQLDISANGRWVTFSSGAGNLVGDAAAFASVFRRDMKKGLVELVNRAADGTPSTGIASSHALSPDGRFVVFRSLGDDLGPPDSNGLADLYCKDLKKGTLTLVSKGFDGAQADGSSDAAAVAAKAKSVAFRSEASNLLEESTALPTRFVFVSRP